MHRIQPCVLVSGRVVGEGGGVVVRAHAKHRVIADDPERRGHQRDARMRRVFIVVREAGGDAAVEG